MAAFNIMWRRPKRGRKVFFIGFNKCGTKSLHGLFADSGYRSLHGRKKHITGAKTNLAKKMTENLALGRPILDGLSGHDVFSDMMWLSDTEVIEGNLLYKELFAAYPDAYFILNTRPVDRWINSRLNHLNDSIGSFLERYMRATGGTRDEVVARWRQLFDEHHEEVRAFFADRGRFLEFDIGGDVGKLIAAVKEDYDLDPGAWRQRGRTSERKANRKR